MARPMSATRGRRWLRHAFASVLISGTVLTAPAPASAVEVLTPCGSDPIDGIDVSGAAWLISCGTHSVLSWDQGASWHNVANLYSPFDRGDGYFYSIPWGLDNRFRIDRMNGHDGTVQSTFYTGPMPERGGVFDSAGRLWGGRCLGGSLQLIRIDMTARTSSVAASGGTCDTESAQPPELRVDSDDVLYFVKSQAVRWIAQGPSLVPAPLAPFAQSGGVAISEGGISSTGGTSASTLREVPGYPDLFVDAGQGGGKIWMRFVEGKWRPTRRAWPTQVDGGYLMATQSGFLNHPEQLLYVRGSLLQALTPTGDTQPADSAEMLDEANRMRSEVGLPPLVGDSRLAQAAHNHATYMQLNQQLGHDETPGTPGFTGEDTSQRCSAAGWTLGCGEIAYAGPGASGRDAVQGWIVTAFHRGLLMSPALVEAGGGFVNPGGWAVLNAPWLLGFIGEPFGYPQGNYTGPLSYGGEIPDPGSHCPDGSISEPYGTAITMNLPQNDPWIPDAMTLTDSAGVAVRGCLLRDETPTIVVFQPDDALQPWTTYTVRASWNGRRPDMVWSFSTAAGFQTHYGDGTPGSKEQNRRKARKKLSIHLKKVGPHRVRVNANPDHIKKAYRVVLQTRNKKKWQISKKMRLTGAKHRKTLTLRKAGQYRIAAPPQRGYAGTVSRRVRIR